MSPPLQGKEVSYRLCRNRFEAELAAFRIEDAQQIKDIGTDEDYTEKQRLLQHIAMEIDAMNVRPVLPIILKPDPKAEKNEAAEKSRQYESETRILMEKTLHGIGSNSSSGEDSESNRPFKRRKRTSLTDLVRECISLAFPLNTSYF